MTKEVENELSRNVRKVGRYSDGERYNESDYRKDNSNS